MDSSEFRCAECGKELYEYKEPPKSFPLKLFLIIAIALLLLGTGIWAYFGLFKDRSDNVEEPVSLSLNKEEISLYVGEYDTLKAILLPENSELKVEYLSKNQDVVIVSENGIMQAIHQGNAIVIATVQTKNGVSVVDSCKVKVSVQEVETPISQPDTNVGKSNTPGHTTPKPARHFNLSFGTLDGSLSYDNNATIKVTKQHTMHLKDAKQSTIVVYPGDVFRDL